MAECQRCIMPDSYPDLTLDSEGICSLCRIHEKSPRLERQVAGKEALRELLASRPAGDYDCVVPLSGGKDSSYALYYIVKELGLRPLAVFSDSGFVSEEAKYNVQHICAELSVDLVVHRARFRRQITREALYIWKYRQEFFSICTPCETNNRSLAIREAMRTKAPFIIWGATDFEDDATTFRDTDSPTWRQRWGAKGKKPPMTPRAIVRFVLEATGLNLVYQTFKMRIPWDRKFKLLYHTLRYLYYLIRNNLEVDVPEGWRRFLPTVETSFEGRGVDTVYIFDYIPYDPQAFVATLKTVLGWQAHDDKESRMDCRLHALVAYDQLRQTGITLDGFTYSVLIRYGLVTREEAKRKEKVLAADLLHECEKLLCELGVGKEGIVR